MKTAQHNIAQAMWSGMHPFTQRGGLSVQAEVLESSAAASPDPPCRMQGTDHCAACRDHPLATERPEALKWPH